MMFESDLKKMKRRETRLVVHVENSLIDFWNDKEGGFGVFQMLFDCSKKDVFWTMDEKMMKVRRCLLKE